MIDELCVARTSAGFSAEEIYPLVTTNAAKALRLTGGLGAIRERVPARRPRSLDVVAVAAASLVSFLCAEWIGWLLGMTGNIVLSRLLGVLLAALAVQYVVDGIRIVLAG